MNQQQRKYAKERVEQIFRSALIKLEKKHTTPAVSLSSKQKVAAIKKGEFKVLAPGRHNSNYLSEYVSFNAEKERSVSSELETEREKLTNKKDSVLDKIMLAESEEALKAIEKFQSDCGL
jgi:hypothetical protein